ncbi:hypothetical protein VPH35_002126 [Triticum aestivum]
MFTVSCSYIHLLDVVASRCRVPFYSYLREMMDDGDVLGGVELDVNVPGSDSLTIRRFFWAQDRVDSLFAYEGAAFQAIIYLQRLYGFVIVDYNYTPMTTYRDLARSAVILATSSVRSTIPVASGDGSVAVGDVDVVAQRRMLHAGLVSTACSF